MESPLPFLYIVKLLLSAYLIGAGIMGQEVKDAGRETVSARVRVKEENRSKEKNHKLQSVFGSIVKPRETPQEPDKVAIAVALGL